MSKTRAVTRNCLITLLRMLLPPPLPLLPILLSLLFLLQLQLQLLLLSNSLSCQATALTLSMVFLCLFYRLQSQRPSQGVSSKMIDVAATATRPTDNVQKPAT